ncbi:MAG: TonB-dependent receptor plug domain-containing protein [Fibrobacteres bacterium]|nr:TonB-dependent receptor plug domain-containing protein [Fibrobacterota bacterium]
MACVPRVRTSRSIPGWRIPALLAYAFAALGFAQDGTGASTGSMGPNALRGSDTARPIDTLTLPASRSQALRKPTASKAVIIPTDVDRQLGNLGDMLQRLAGVHVMRAGELGDYLGVSLRGASESQVQVYVNGVLQNQASDASLYLSDWDLSRVERVEVYKGLAPEDLPGAPMGGAINIITRDAAPGGPGLRAAMGAGSFGSFKANGTAELAAGAWRGRLQAARDQADGDFPFYDDGGLEYKPGRHPEGAERLGPDDLIRKLRTNNAHALTDVAGDLSWHPNAEAELGLQADLSDLDKRIPAPYAGVDSTVSINTDLTTDKASLHGRGRWARGQDEASLDLSGSWLRQVYLDTGRGAIDLGDNEDRDLYLDGRADLRARLDLGGGWGLAALGGYGAGAYFYSNRIADRAYPGVFRYTGEGKFTPSFTHGRHAWQASLDIVLNLDEQNAARVFAYDGSFLPGERWDRRALLRLGYQYHLDENRWLFAEGGQAARQPTFLELFGDRGTVKGNAFLGPESGYNGSAGAHAGGSKWSAELSVFAAAQRNLITLEQNSRYVLVYKNTGRARILGAEARVSAAPVPWSRSEIDLTLQRAAEGSEWLGDLRIPYRPDFQASFRQVLTARGWALGASAYYQGLAYPNAANLPSLFDSYSHSTQWQARCDLDLSWRRSRWLLAAGVRNVFDQHEFDFFNFPLPGRSFAATVQAEL